MKREIDMVQYASDLLAGPDAKLSKPAQTVAEWKDAKHTPGPWRVSQHGRFFDVLSSEKTPIVKWAGFDDCDRATQEHVANARLMAAAPEMLEALEQIAETGIYDKMTMSYEEERNHMRSIAEAALSKARGQHG